MYAELVLDPLEKKKEKKSVLQYIASALFQCGEMLLFTSLAPFLSLLLAELHLS